MKPLPPSMDELMWLVAEQDDSVALEAFGKRYPEHRGEMASRLQLVRGLKGNRPEFAIQKEIPAFSLRPEPRPAIPRWAAVAASTLLLAGVAFGSYAVVQRWSPRQPQQPNAMVQVKPPQSRDLLPGVQPQPKPIDPAVQGDNGQQQPNREPALLPHERPISLRLEGVTLLEAINAVVRLSGLSVEVAPGMPEAMVTMEYSNQSGLRILQDIGATFGFTPFEQEPGRVLLIPATDPKVHDGTSSADSDPSSDSLGP